MANIAVIILTFNENKHVCRAVENALRVASEVFVVDSYSTDATVELAQRAGARVMQHKFVNQAKQFNWALENAPLTADWVMRLDADEVLEDDLIEEINARVPALPAEICGVSMNRKHIFMGRWIRHGGRFPITMLRLWRRGCAMIEDRWMDEHIILTKGTSVTFDHCFADWNLNDINFFTQKHNQYATREAIDVILRRHRRHAERGDELTRQNTSSRAAVTRWIKENIYNRLPFYAGPVAYFFYRYVIRFGFLDGREGLAYHFLQGFWFRFLVAINVIELEGQLARGRSATTLEDQLTALTGFNVVGGANDQTT